MCDFTLRFTQKSPKSILSESVLPMLRVGRQKTNIALTSS